MLVNTEKSLNFTYNVLKVAVEQQEKKTFKSEEKKKTSEIKEKRLSRK